MGIGAYIRETREAQGLSLSKAAQAWGIDKAHLSLIESGQRSQLQADTLLKLSRGLGVTVDELLTRANGQTGDGKRKPGVARPGTATKLSS